MAQAFALPSLANLPPGMAEARTTYGVIGVKVWIFKGEVFDQPEPVAAPEPAEAVAPALEQQPA